MCLAAARGTYVAHMTCARVTALLLGGGGAWCGSKDIKDMASCYQVGVASNLRHCLCISFERAALFDRVRLSLVCLMYFTAAAPSLRSDV